MEKEEEIRALRRELEQLKAQMGENSDRGSTREVVGGSPARQGSPVKLSDSFSSRQQTKVSSSQRSNTAGIGDGESNLDARVMERLKEEVYVDHVPVDTKRGKWWLKDRQVLSRNVPTSGSEAIEVKVREIWLWSGRSVILDKIVTVPISLEQQETFACTDEKIDSVPMIDSEDIACASKFKQQVQPGSKFPRKFESEGVIETHINE